MKSSSRPKRSGRSATVLYGILSAVLLIAILVMALIVRPPPPPSVAALGPSPQEQIKEARNDQKAGSADGVAAPSSRVTQDPTSNHDEDSQVTRTSPTTPSKAPKVPPTRRCFGDPPRQTEDPHSPPCVFKIFDDDNGGQTAFGVNATEVRLAVHENAPRETVDALISHFNRRYEFYGRRLVIAKHGQPATDKTDPSESTALANEVIASRPFAAISNHIGPNTLNYHSRLAEERIHSIVTRPPNINSGDVQDGFYWSVFPTLDVRGGAAAEFICKALVNRPAAHAGDQTLSETNRKFGLVNTSFSGIWPKIDFLQNGIKRCDAQSREFRIANDLVEYNNTIEQLRSDNYTTVVQIGPRNNFTFTGMAEQRGYLPEWMHLGLILEDNERNWSRSENKESSKSAFGLAPWVRARSVSEIPACWAMEEEGRSCATYQDIEPLYKGLLVMASGVQASGPKLTEESFRRALRETRWPNPKAGKPPFWQQRVGFEQGDPAFYNDYAVWWWNEDIPSQQFDTFGGNPDGRGSFCYLNRGGRFMSGEFPADSDSRLFSRTEPCR